MAHYLMRNIWSTEKILPPYFITTRTNSCIQTPKIFAYLPLSTAVSEPRYFTDLTAAVYTWPLVAKRMPMRRHRCLKSVYVNRVFCRHRDTLQWDLCYVLNKSMWSHIHSSYDCSFGRYLPRGVSWFKRCRVYRRVPVIITWALLRSAFD